METNKFAREEVGRGASVDEAVADATDRFTRDAVLALNEWSQVSVNLEMKKLVVEQTYDRYGYPPAVAPKVIVVFDAEAVGGV